jgi:excisionase family DNA binding protein
MHENRARTTVAGAPVAKPSAPLPPLDPLQRYTVEEATRYLRTSRPTLYELINAGLIASIQEGRRRYVPGSEIVRRSAAA